MVARTFRYTTQEVEVRLFVSREFQVSQGFTVDPISQKKRLGAGTNACHLSTPMGLGKLAKDGRGSLGYTACQNNERPYLCKVDREN